MLEGIEISSKPPLNKRRRKIGFDYLDYYGIHIGPSDYRSYLL